jgi:hypothetical protein
VFRSLDPRVVTSYSGLCGEGGGVVDDDDDDDDGGVDDADADDDDDDSGADDDDADDDDADGMVRRRCTACLLGVSQPGDPFNPSHGMNPLKKSLADRGCGAPCNTACPAVVRVSSDHCLLRGLASMAATRADFRRPVMGTLCLGTASGIGSTATGSPSSPPSPASHPSPSLIGYALTSAARLESQSRPSKVGDSTSAGALVLC